MPLSMTGFARIESEIRYPEAGAETGAENGAGDKSWGNFNWELRSVNHRYLETSFRLPEHLRELEPQLRERLRKSLARGKVDVALHLHVNDQVSSSLAINTALVQQLGNAIEQIEAQLPNAAAISALDILKWPGVTKRQDLDREQVLAQTLAQFDAAIAELVAHRAREGAELAQLIEQRLVAISGHVVEVRAAMPNIINAQREKLNAKLAELHIEIDPARLEQEVVLLTQKADVDEELDRLDTHVLEVRRTLQQQGSIGRRLDFLMQELNREANTLSSKSIVSETTLAAVALKVLIEQMREQIQNIE